MEKRDNEIKEIYGAEAIVIHNGNVILGMQKAKRWYKLENEKKAAIIKTLGGQIKKEDKNSTKKTVLRELREEVKKVEIKEIKICDTPIFTKSIRMAELNPYERQCNLKMTADFYVLEIMNNNQIMPNDLPALLSIPIKDFVNLEFNKETELKKFQNNIIKNNEFFSELPEYCALMIPEEVKRFIKKFEGDVENKKDSF